MKLNVKSAQHTVEKWARRVGGATQDYADGAKGAGAKWHAGAQAGAQNYRTGVTEAAGAGRFEKMVQAAGPGKYERGITEKGAARFGPGAAAAQPDFHKAMAPVLAAIEAIDVPPKGPRGADSNYNRSATVGRALRAFKTKR